MAEKKKRKFLKRFLITTFLLLVILVVGGYFYLNHIIKYTVTEYGPDYTGSKIEVEDVNVNPFKGYYVIKGFTLYNPEGFKTKYAVYISEIRIRMKMMDLFAEKMVIEEIFIDGPDIIYEKIKGGKSNFDAILHNIDFKLGYVDSLGQLIDTTTTTEVDTVSTYEIQFLKILKGKIRWSPRWMGRKALTIPLPSMEMRDIGKDQSGKQSARAMRKVISSMNKNIKKETRQAERKMKKTNKKTYKQQQKEYRRE